MLLKAIYDTSCTSVKFSPIGMCFLCWFLLYQHVDIFTPNLKFSYLSYRLMSQRAHKEEEDILCNENRPDTIHTSRLYTHLDYLEGSSRYSRTP